ncbi:4-hydroxythreonine-4-phosphate dehydrogenase PdxA [Myxacorys almedinensis]|uniref:4-hydroxythreonine-4-phosphate dehydrogenase n=1 Tax=Myxacorys almedinensis A TaxID=2690445 RepID=A0A8J7YY16_9CYAN|nr:4-hydroxythreonine-4-phosphate dehydrogenase PdxA [Myxacorys almedinensis]NDJ16752.1 4-hydroxythreonine-4-phosphate dehydrogenase PdxA [Myxacorys almedinensis A]
MNRARLIITLGDPAGIGAEVVLKALADPTIAARADVTISGSSAYLQATYDRLKPICDALAHPCQFKVLDAEIHNPVTLGIGNANSGDASFRWLEGAIAQTLHGKFDSVVTAPIAKSAWKAAGHCYPGQTEFLAERAGVSRFGMLFVAQSPYTGWMLRTLLATTHIPLRHVADTLTPELLTLKLELLLECLQHDFEIAQPRIAIAGLNPHSGEQGQLGREEWDWMSAWLEAMRQRFPQAVLEGLLPPDTLWVKPGQAWFGTGSVEAAHDGYLALYHDQGLIPVKLMAFDRAVNTSVGLPFVRTSPDHGTAFDIAGQGVADATSMKAAIHLAIKFAEQGQAASTSVISLRS